MFLSVPLLVTPVMDTVWWNTPGGMVTERRDAAGDICSLLLYNNTGSVLLEWADVGRVLVTAVDRVWQFPEGAKMPAAMKMGDEWVSNGGDSAIIQAEGHGNAVSFAVNRPIDDLLKGADHVEIRTTGSDLSIMLNPAKMNVLLSHVRQCRAIARR